MSGNGIPKPEFQSSRPRRSSIGQGAAYSSAGNAEAKSDPDPAPAAVAASPPVAPETPRPRPTSARGSTRPAGNEGGKSASTETPNKRLMGSKDILLSLPEDQKTRMVNTITWSQPYTGIGQQQKFIRKAISDLCERLESEYNEGKPFPAPAVLDD